MRFIKMHGIGNDYVYVNGFQHTVSDPAALAPVIADRHTGVGGDGLILVLPPRDGVAADVRMQMFNADGSEAEMCGNGVRCVCKLAHDHGITSANPMRIETGNGVLTLEYATNGDGKVATVKVNMGAPILKPGDIPVQAASDDAIIDQPTTDVIDWANINTGQQWIDDAGFDNRMTCVSMGNPHVTFYCKDVSRVPLEIVGPAIEKHSLFPNRINVHFVQVHSGGEVTMRTWERGTGITLACGTGASAVCVSGVLTGRTGNKILAHLPGGDLELQFDGGTSPVYMSGPATEVFQGEWNH